MKRGKIGVRLHCPTNYMNVGHTTIMPGYLLISSSYFLVLSLSLIGLLINFVIFYLLSGLVLLIARECGNFIGLSYPIVYTGAVSVLFVFVVLLVENQHLGLAGFVSLTHDYILPTVLPLFGILEGGSLSPEPASFSFVPLLLEVSVPSSSLASGLYGEAITTLALVGWVLIVATFGPLTALCVSDV